MHKNNVLLQDDLGGSEEDTAQPERGVHWAMYVAGIGIGLMIFLMGVLGFVYLRAGQ